MLAQAHPRQSERLAALHRYDILDTPRESMFDDIVGLTARVCDVPVSVINFIDRDRQWFKAEVGLGVRSTPLETSLCSHVILENDFVEVPDTLADPRMCDNPLCIAEGGFRFYAGALLSTADGLPLGTLCVLDTRPRELTALQRDFIRIMAKRVMSELDLRQALEEAQLLRREIDHRVKNSLASVGAIIALQAARTSEPAAREALGAVQQRISAFEALHEELQHGGSETLVDLASLLERSVSKLRHLIPERVNLAIQVAPYPVDSRQANAVALAVNEFVTNSAKHAFPDDRAGAIRLDGRRTGQGYQLSCSDDGIGDAQALDRIARSSGLGSRIMRTLAASVGARIDWECRDPGIAMTWTIARGGEDGPAEA